MFRYFPTNYVWNLSVDLAIEMGARIGEIEAMCAPLQDAAKAPDAAGTRAFRETWVRMADRLCRSPKRIARGHVVRGRESPRRSYLLIAELWRTARWARALYQRVLELFGKGVAAGDTQRVEIPTKRASGGLYVRPRVRGPGAALVQVKWLTRPGR
jgi:hypothetical protein